MPARKLSEDFKPEPHFKVRLVFPGAVIHVASWTEPERSAFGGWSADWITDWRYGDTIGELDWSLLTAITWRWSE